MVNPFKTLGLILAVALSTVSSSYAGDTVTVYKTPTCGCCSKWVSHMRENGFEVAAHNQQDLALIKQMSGIPRGQQSCHTAMIDGYIIEGHVPASDVKRLLAERPDIRGLAVPGMPIGSPGMEGSRQDRYQVMTLPKSAPSTVFAQH